MQLFVAAILFNGSATSCHFEMYKSVPIMEAAWCRITTVNGKWKHIRSQQSLISLCATIKKNTQPLKIAKQCSKRSSNTY